MGKLKGTERGYLDRIAQPLAAGEAALRARRTPVFGGVPEVAPIVVESDVRSDSREGLRDVVRRTPAGKASSLQQSSRTHDALRAAAVEPHAARVKSARGGTGVGSRSVVTDGLRGGERAAVEMHSTAPSVASHGADGSPVSRARRAVNDSPLTVDRGRYEASSGVGEAEMAVTVASDVIAVRQRDLRAVGRSKKLQDEAVVQVDESLRVEGTRQKSDHTQRISQVDARSDSKRVTEGDSLRSSMAQQDASRPAVAQKESGGTRIHIGTVEVRTTQPPVVLPQRAAPAQVRNAATASASPARSLTWRYGLVQS